MKGLTVWRARRRNDELVYVEKPGYEFWRLKRFGERAGMRQVQFDSFIDNPHFRYYEDPAVQRWRFEENRKRRKGTKYNDYDPVHLAVADHDVEAAQSLLDQGHVVDAIDRDGRTPLFYAVLEGHEPLVDLLIRRGASLDAQDHLGATPLHFAAQEYRPHFASRLLLCGAWVDTQDIHGNSPLWRAISLHPEGDELINLLISHGADMRLRNRAGVSPEELERRAYAETMRALVA